MDLVFVFPFGYTPSMNLLPGRCATWTCPSACSTLTRTAHTTTPAPTPHSTCTTRGSVASPSSLALWSTSASVSSCAPVSLTTPACCMNCAPIAWVLLPRAFSNR